MSMRTHRLSAAAFAAILLTASACASSTDGSGASSDTPAPATSTTAPSTTGAGSATPGPTASETPSTGASGTLPADLRTRPEVAAAISDAASRANVAPEAVLIAAWSPVTWNDGSLGCPQKGMVYTQALVDGELLMLRVEQTLFQYHAGSGGAFTYCAAPDASYSVTS